MIYLALAVSCSLTIGMIFKHTGRLGLDRLELLTANYFAASVLAAAFVLGGDAAGPLQVTGGLAVLGIVTGALFICGFFLLSLATDMAGMGLAVGVMRVSVVIPFLASWWIWGEVPTAFQAAGLLTAIVAFFLLAGGRGGVNAQTDARPQTAKVFVVLSLVFLVGGIIDTLLKTFEETYSESNSSAVYLAIIFAVAFVIGLAVKLPAYVRSRLRPSGRTVAWGIFLGAANYGSVEFLLAAISRLSGTFVFPANNIAIVLGAAILGVVFWKERLNRLSIIGLALASIALILLNF